MLLQRRPKQLGLPQELTQISVREPPRVFNGQRRKNLRANAL
jgi:hypothetical protein